MRVAERLLSLSEVAEILGVPEATLYRWRYLGEGPPGYKVGRFVRYRQSAVEAWLESRSDASLRGSAPDHGMD